MSKAASRQHSRYNLWSTHVDSGPQAKICLALDVVSEGTFGWRTRAPPHRTDARSSLAGLRLMAASNL